MSELSTCFTFVGIGHASAKTLFSLGVKSVQDLNAATVENLSTHFPEKQVAVMKQLALGVDPTPVSPSSLQQV